MRSILARLAAALVLTLPIYIGLANVPMLERWFLDGDGWQAIEPILHGMGWLGIRGDGRILIGGMLLLSFLIALFAIAIAIRVWRSLHPGGECNH